MSRFELGIAAATLVGVVALGVLQALATPSRCRSSTSCAAVRSRGTRCSAGSTALAAGGTWSFTPPHVSPREWSSTGSTTASSSPTPATSRGACERRFARPDEPHWLVFDAEAVSHVEATGVEALRELAVRLPRDGVGPVVARMKPSVHEVLVASGVAEAIGEERFFPTIRAAVAACLARDAAPVAGPA